MSSVWRQVRPTAWQKQALWLVASVGSITGSLTFLVPEVWVPAIREGGFLYALVTAVLGPLGVGDPTPVYMLLGGLFLGTASLWLYDILKQWPGTVLWWGIIVATVLFWMEWPDGLAPNVFVGGPLLCAGVLIGLQTGGLGIWAYFRDDQENLWPRGADRLFPTSITFTLYWTVGLLLVGLVDAHLAVVGGVGFEQTDIAFRHLVAAVFLAVPIASFQQYKSKERIIQLGPSRSGKTSIQGGLYMSVDEKVERPSELLRKIHANHMRDGQFPDRTEVYSLAKQTDSARIPIEHGASADGDGTDNPAQDSAFLIEFSYITRGLMPREKVITTVDYPGEFLTGIEIESWGNEVSISDFVENYAETDELTNWERAIANLREGKDEFDDRLEPKEVMENVAALVHEADVIMFTIPLDDFITPILQQRPNQVQEYHQRHLWEIRPCDDDDATYRTKRLTDGEDGWVKLDTASGSERAVPVNDEKRLTGFDPDPDQWLGDVDGDGFGFYREVRGTRQPPSEYLEKYNRMTNALDEKNHRFVWMVTMADLVFKDFSQFASQGRDYDTLPIDEETIDIDHEDNGIKIGRSEIDTNINLLTERSNEPWRPQTNTEEYKLFSRWILNEYLIAVEPDIEDWMDGTRERYPVPVWFEIPDGSTENRFKQPRQSSVLNGERFVRKRLRGERFKPNYPGGLLSVLRARLSSTKPLSETEQAYELMHELKEEWTPTHESEGDGQ